MHQPEHHYSILHCFLCLAILRLKGNCSKWCSSAVGHEWQGDLVYGERGSPDPRH